MSDSLRDQLLKAGFAPPRKEPQRAPEKRGRRDGHAAQPHEEKAKQPPRTHDVDLARAYAIRAQAEKAEREAAQREAQKQAQERKERKRRPSPCDLQTRFLPRQRRFARPHRRRL